MMFNMNQKQNFYERLEISANHLKFLKFISALLTAFIKALF